MIKPMKLAPEAQAAMQAAEATLAEARADGRPYGICLHLRQLAHLQAGALQLEAAEHGLQQALRWAHAGLGADLQVDILVDLCDLCDLWSQAEDQQPHGEGEAVRERLRGYVAQARERAPAMSERGAEARVMLRLSAILNRCGDRDDAAQMQARALRLINGPAVETGNPHVMPGLGRLADS
jgi:hypothetical protein